MKKDIKYLINQNIINFNPVDYQDDEDNIISYDNIKRITGVPTTLKELKTIIKQRVQENPENPYLLDIDTSLIRSMYCLFSDNICKNIKTLDLSTWNTSKVTNMSHMFESINAQKIKFSKKFDTSNVINMSNMFAWCNFTDIDLSMFNTSKVKDMSYMFYHCVDLQKLNLKSFDTSNVTTMEGMFQSCTALTNMNISSFDTSNVKNFNHMFSDCTLLQKLDLSNFKISGDISWMFSECVSLININLLGWDLDNTAETYGMFDECESLSIRRIKTTDSKIKKQFLKDNNYE